MRSKWICLSIGVFILLNAGSILAQTINKPSIQVRLQVHKGYKGDPETWSWTPIIDFRANGPFSPGSALSVEYSLPSKSWKFDCYPQDAGPSSAWLGVRDCGQNPPDTEAVTYAGPVDFKINLKNELEGKSATLLSGKFKVEKFHEGVVDLPQVQEQLCLLRQLRLDSAGRLHLRRVGLQLGVRGSDWKHYGPEFV